MCVSYRYDVYKAFALIFIAGSDFVGGEFTLILPQTMCCVGV